MASIFRATDLRDNRVVALKIPHPDMEADPILFDRFKRDEINILVASDVAARGLDVTGVSHVFNFDVPIHSEDYVHSIGRTGRAGRSGAAFTLVTKREIKHTDAIAV